MTSKRIERLRDKLLARGRPTVRPGPPGPPGPPDSPDSPGEPGTAAGDKAPAPQVSPELAALAERVRPFAEVMYLVLAADSCISQRERDILRGALRSLTEGALSSAALDEMLHRFEQQRKTQGLDLRLDHLASTLYADRADARLALGLATAAADADNGVGPEERAVIVALADRLGISDADLRALLRECETPP